MTLEDPFYVVKDEVFKALNKTRGLYLRWQELAQTAAPPHSPEAEWTCTELKNALRSIEWDLDDLEDTISIVEKNSSKFKIDNKEITERRKFIDNTRKEVKEMRNRVSHASGANRAGHVRPGHPISPSVCRQMWFSPVRRSDNWEERQETVASPTAVQMARHERWLSHMSDDEDSTPLITHWNDQPPLHESLLRDPMDPEYELAMAASAANIKKLSTTINKELAEQQILIDELTIEAASTEEHFISVKLLMARTLRYINDRRQWWAIGILVLMLLLVLWLFKSL